MARRPRERQFGSRHVASGRSAHRGRAAKTLTQRRAIETSLGPERILGRPGPRRRRRTWPAVRTGASRPPHWAPRLNQCQQPVELAVRTAATAKTSSFFMLLTSDKSLLILATLWVEQLYITRRDVQTQRRGFFAAPRGVFSTHGRELAVRFVERPSVRTTAVPVDPEIVGPALETQRVDRQPSRHDDRSAEKSRFP